MSSRYRSPQVDLSIVIVNFNGGALLRECLDSIDRNLHGSREIIVVDNASDDGSADMVERDRPAVRLLRRNSNAGFAVANNEGAREARGRLLLLLNNDTRLLCDLAPAIALLDADPAIGIVGGMMIGPRGEFRHSAGRFPSLARLVRIASLYRREGPFRDGHFPEPLRPVRVDWIEGSLLLTRTDLYRRLGGLDEGTFLYGEDVDYCRRAMDRGAGTAYLPAIRYLHHGGYHAGRYPYILQGLARYHDRHSGWMQRGCARAILAGKLALHSMRAARRGS